MGDPDHWTERVRIVTARSPERYGTGRFETCSSSIRAGGPVAGTPGVDFPEQRGVVGGVVSGRGEVLVSWIESADDREIVVTAGEERAPHPGAPPGGGGRVAVRTAASGPA